MHWYNQYWSCLYDAARLNGLMKHRLQPPIWSLEVDDNDPRSNWKSTVFQKNRESWTRRAATLEPYDGCSGELWCFELPLYTIETLDQWIAPGMARPNSLLTLSFDLDTSPVGRNGNAKRMNDIKIAWAAFHSAIRNRYWSARTEVMARYHQWLSFRSPMVQNANRRYLRRQRERMNRGVNINRNAHGVKHWAACFLIRWCTHLPASKQLQNINIIAAVGQ